MYQLLVTAWIQEIPTTYYTYTSLLFNHSFTTKRKVLIGFKWSLETQFTPATTMRLDSKVALTSLVWTELRHNTNQWVWSNLETELLNHVGSGGANRELCHNVTANYWRPVNWPVITPSPQWFKCRIWTIFNWTAANQHFINVFRRLIIQCFVCTTHYNHHDIGWIAQVFSLQRSQANIHINQSNRQEQNWNL